MTPDLVTRPSVTAVIPTRDRPSLLREAVQSVLDQSLGDVEVVVVDDGSHQPVELASHPRIRVLRRTASTGHAAARNAGVAEATGRYLTFVDDDDRLHPWMLEASLAAIEGADLPGPIASVCAVEVVDRHGTVTSVRVPPASRRRGAHWSLEPIEPGRSYLCKQTLVVTPEALAEAGGWDEAFRSRVHTELFWRLNPVCSLVGVERPGYQLRAHDGPRLSTDPELRQRSFAQLRSKHGELLRAHPDAYADLLLSHTRRSLQDDRKVAAAVALVRGVATRPNLDQVRRAVGAVRTRR